MGLACIELVTLLHIRTVEATMQVLFDKSGETIKRIYQRWGIGVFALPVLLVIALIGVAMTPGVALPIDVRSVYPDTRLAPRSIVISTSIRSRE